MTNCLPAQRVWSSRASSCKRHIPSCPWRSQKLVPCKCRDQTFEVKMIKDCDSESTSSVAFLKSISGLQLPLLFMHNIINFFSLKRTSCVGLWIQADYAETCRVHLTPCPMGCVLTGASATHLSERHTKRVHSVTMVVEFKKRSLVNDRAFFFFFFFFLFFFLPTLNPVI